MASARPAALMNPAPSSSAVQPETAMPGGDFRPTACPTLTAAAELMPSGTMKVMEMTLTAMLCAASETSSKRAAITVTTPKTAPSTRICMAEGNPRATSLRMSAHCGRQLNRASLLTMLTLPNGRGSDRSRDRKGAVVGRRRLLRLCWWRRTAIRRTSEVEEVGADPGEGDGLDNIHRLKVAAEGATFRR